LLARTLRLEAAELSDVGRRRERNQDNVAHLIPTDQHELDEKGALFIVCTLFLQMMCYSLIFSPGYSLAMNLAHPNMRGRTAALMSMSATAVGYGLGAQIVGILSDMLRPTAGEQSLRYALIIMMFAMLWTTAHFAIAYFKLRATRRDLPHEPAGARLEAN